MQEKHFECQRHSEEEILLTDRTSQSYLFMKKGLNQMEDLRVQDLKASSKGSVN